MPMAMTRGARWELGPDDPGFPTRLMDDGRCPFKRIYGIGDASVLEGDFVAIVGARKATPYGLACAQLAADCAVQMGIGVVSGGAIGCDQAGMMEGLAGGVPVIAVMGCGADQVYPATAAPLFQRVVDERGAVVSLLPWGTPPRKWAFVERNKLIARLARAVIICEAGYPSGTFSTAQDAADSGREVLVFPGSIFSPNSCGSNYLIASNPAYMPVWDVQSVQVALSRIYGRLRYPTMAVGKVSDLPREQKLILRALQASSMTPADLARSIDMELIEVMRLLASLELRNCVRKMLDGRYVLSPEEFLSANGYD